MTGDTGFEVEVAPCENQKCLQSAHNGYAFDIVLDFNLVNKDVTAIISCMA